MSRLDVILGIFGGLILGLGIGMDVEESLLKKQATEHNCAHYDAQTGDFTWNDEGEKTNDD